MAKPTTPSKLLVDHMQGTINHNPPAMNSTIPQATSPSVQAMAQATEAAATETHHLTSLPPNPIPSPPPKSSTNHPVPTLLLLCPIVLIFILAALYTHNLHRQGKLHRVLGSVKTFFGRWSRRCLSRRRSERGSKSMRSGCDQGESLYSDGFVHKFAFGGEREDAQMEREESACGNGGRAAGLGFDGMDERDVECGRSVRPLQRWSGSGDGIERYRDEADMGIELAELGKAKVVCDRFSVSVV